VRLQLVLQTTLLCAPHFSHFLSIETKMPGNFSK